jgi:hypothetical protein
MNECVVVLRRVPSIRYWAPALGIVFALTLPQSTASLAGESTWQERAKLTASEGGDGFGHSVAIDGDTVVIGAQGDD